MRKFRRLFALLFILSLFLGALHEASHNHHDGTMCEVCLLAHSPGLLQDVPSFVFIEQYHTPFPTSHIAYPTLRSIQTRSRSPPTA